MKKLTTLLFFTFLVANAQYKITHYNSSNSNLPHDLCYQIIQDKEGFIWLGTDNGLVKFNGSTFQNFNRNQGLSNSFVIDVFESDNEKLVATWGGGCYSFDGKRFKQIIITKDNFSKQLQIVKNSNFIYSLENRFRINYYNILTKNVQFYGLYNLKSKLYWCNSDNNQDRIIANKAISVNLQIEKIDNEVYCFTDKNSPQFQGILRLNKNFKVEYAFPFLNSFEIIGISKYKSHFKAVTPTSIIEFNNNKILNIENKAFENQRILQFTENDFFKVYLLQNIKTNSNEIFVEDIKSKKKTIYNSNFLKSPVSDILISKDNSIWISTYGNGLFLIQKPLIHVDYNILIGNYAFDFVEKPQYNYFLTENFVIINDKKTNAINKFAVATVSSFRKADSDTIFFIKKDPTTSLIRYKDQIMTNKIGPNEIELNNKKIRYGDNRLSYNYKGKWNDVFLNLTSEEKLFLKIKKILFYNNNYWVFSNNGIFILDIHFKLTKRIEVENGLLQNNIITAINYKNKLYLLYFTGYSIIENEIIKNYLFYNNENDTFNDFVITKNGNVWFASQKGLVLLKDNSFLKFTRNEGLSSSFYSRIYLNSKNELVALGNNGVDFINANYEAKKNNPKIVITNKIKAKPLQKRTVINSNENFVIKTEIIAFETSKPRLEYKLNEKKWAVQNTGQFDFTNFSSGTYQIQFRIKYPFSKYIYSPIFLIEKKAVWYLRWYFYIPMFILILVTTGYLFYRRLKALNARNKRLENLLSANEKLQFQLNEMRHNVSQDFHDELGNKIAGITMMSDRLLYDKHINEQENTSIINRINKDSQELYQGIRDFIWSIDSKNDTLDQLITVLIDFGIELFQNSTISFFTDNQVIDKNIKLPVYWNRQLLLLFKEAMTNALKHSKANKINLQIKFTDNILMISLQDNGKGFDDTKIKRKNGIINMFKRAVKIEGLLEIESSSGTKLTFTGKV